MPNPTEKLSQIPPSGVPPVNADQFVAVTGGNTDVLFSLSQLKTAIPPGAQGPQGIQGPPGPQGPPGNISGVPDPLSLTKGLIITALDPNVSGNPNDPQAVQINVTFDALVGNVGFTGANAVELNYNFNHGMNTYSFGNAAGVTAAKTSPSALSITMNAFGAGERDLATYLLNGWGFSDTFFWGGGGVKYACGPIAGDEGVGFTPGEFGLYQATSLSLATVTSVTRTTFSTTTTQVITGSNVVQTISVASTVGANVNDWIVFNQQLPVAGGSQNLCAAQITAVGSGNISCICPNNFVSGVTITPALVLGLNSLPNMGEQRVMVNLSGAAYSTGQIYLGWPLGGIGTSWGNTMVGGSATNIGALSIDQDIFSDVPFAGAPLYSWYQLLSASSTSIFTYENTAFGIKSYAGNAQTQAQLFSKTCTITIASPALVTLGTGVAPVAGTAVRFTTTGALPTGITPNTPYWVANPSGATFNLSTVSNPAIAGTLVTTTGSQSGTHTVFNGGYSIRPCATVLYFQPAGAAQVVCETSTATWQVGDSVECIVCPYTYTQGWQYGFAHWNPGATLTGAMWIFNAGARTYSTGLTISNRAGAGTLGNINSDPWAFGTGLILASCQTGLLIESPQTGIAITGSSSSAITLNGQDISPNAFSGISYMANSFDFTQGQPGFPAGMVVWSTGNGPTNVFAKACLDLNLENVTHKGIILRGFSNSANMVECYNGATLTGGFNQDGTSFSNIYQLNPSTFGGIYFGAPVEGLITAITDSPVSTLGAAITTGGGGNHVLAYYDGTRWIVVACFGSS